MKTLGADLANFQSSALDARAEAVSSQLSQQASRGGVESIDKAAREFEAYFVQFMLREMRKSIPDSGLFGDRQKMAVFESMLDESIGKSVSEGRGIGLADFLREEMLEDAGLSSAGGSREFLGDAGYAAPISTGYERSRGMNQYQRAMMEGEGESRRVTSDFGVRVHPINGETQFHTGIDVAMPAGSAVRAVAPGKVVFAGEQGGYGQVVVVDHANGYQTRYAHNEELHVKAGQKVDRQTVLADSGSSGSSTGPHLHFEVRKHGVAVDPGTLGWARLP